MLTAPQLPLLSLVLQFAALTDIGLPANPGSLWRGLLGKQLMASALRDDAGDLVYDLLLAPTTQTCLAEPQRGERPAAIVIDMPGHLEPTGPRLWHMVQSIIPRGGLFNVGVTLFGRATACANAVIDALRRAAHEGIGTNDSAGCRGIAHLTGLQVRSPGGQLQPFIDEALIATTGLPAAQSPQIPDFVGPVVRIHIVQPLRIEIQRFPSGPKMPLAPDELSAAHLVGHVIRRIAAIAACHCGVTLDLHGLGGMVQGLQLHNTDLHQCQQHRYSGNQKREIPTSGVLGSADIDLINHPWVFPFLHLAQLTHVGKGAVMGMGAIRVGT